MKTFYLTDNQTGKKLVITILLILICLFTTYGLSTRNTYFIQAGEGNQGAEEGLDRNRSIEQEVDDATARPVSGDAERIDVRGEIKEETPRVPKAISAFTSSYRGSRIDSEYLGLIWNACKHDVYLIKLVVATAVSESGMGRDLPTRHSNFWGWFKRGDRNYDPDRPTMSKDICNGLGKSYRGVESNRGLAVTYTGNHNPDRWLSAVQWSLSKMR